jgi:hypothetical protein
VAKQIAMTHGATLHLLHVVPKLPAFGEAEVSEGEHTTEEVKAETRLREIASSDLGGVKSVVHTCLAAPRGGQRRLVRRSEPLLGPQASRSDTVTNLITGIYIVGALKF